MSEDIDKAAKLLKAQELLFQARKLLCQAVEEGSEHVRVEGED